MKNLKKKEFLYNAVSDIDDDVISDFLVYDKSLPEKEERNAAYRPVLGIIGAFALFIAVCSVTYGGIKYLEYKGSMIQKPGQSESVTDENGKTEQGGVVQFRLAKKSVKSSNGSSETVYEYDEYGRVTKETTTTGKGEKSTTENTYDEAGDLVKQYTNRKLTGGQKEEEKRESTYDAFGRIIKLKAKNETNSGTSDYSKEYEYDEDGRIIKMVQSPGGTFEYEYTDKNGSYIMTGAGETTTVTLDENGFLIKYETEKNGEQTITEIEYDGHGRRTKTTINGKVNDECIRTYNGELVMSEESTRYTSDGAEKTYRKYEYDGYNNEKGYEVRTASGDVVSKVTYEYEAVYAEEPVKKLVFANLTGDMSRPVTKEKITEALSRYGGDTVIIKINPRKDSFLSDIKDAVDGLGYDTLADNTYNKKVYQTDEQRILELKANAARVSPDALYELLYSYHVTSITVYRA